MLLNILMKLIMIMYLHESLNENVLRARNSYFWFNLVALLVKLLYCINFKTLNKKIGSK